MLCKLILEDKFKCVSNCKGENMFGDMEMPIPQPERSKDLKFILFSNKCVCSSITRFRLFFPNNRYCE